MFLGSSELTDGSEELHELLPTLSRRQSEILPQERSIHVFLVRFDHGVGLEGEDVFHTPLL